MMPERPAGEDRALRVEALHEHLRAAVHLAQHVLLGNLAILEDELARVGAAHAELVELLGGGEALHAFFDDEGRHGLRALVLGCRAHVDDQHVRIGAVRDPHLVAVGDPAIAFLLGLARHGAHHVAARARLAHGERAHEFAAAKLREILLALRLGPVEVEVVDAEIRVRAVRKPDRSGGARDFLHRHHVGEISQARAAVRIRHRHAQEAQLAQLSPHVRRERVLRVDLGGARRQLRVAHALHRVSKRVEFLVEVGIEKQGAN
jgi:hypothetical protein